MTGWEKALIERKKVRRASLIMGNVLFQHGGRNRLLFCDKATLFFSEINAIAPGDFSILSDAALLILDG
jgi:hypothetical protein